MVRAYEKEMDSEMERGFPLRPALMKDLGKVLALDREQGNDWVMDSGSALELAPGMDLARGLGTTMGSGLAWELVKGLAKDLRTARSWVMVTV